MGKTERGLSQRKEEFLIDARDAGSDAQEHDDASQPHVRWFQESTQWHGGAGQQEASHTQHPLYKDRRGTKSATLLRTYSDTVSLLKVMYL